MASWSVEQGDGNGGPGLTATIGTPKTTIVWLHGLGDSAHGWIDAFTSSAIRVKDTKVILPTATDLPVTINGGMEMPAWYDIVALNDNKRQVDNAGIAKSVDRVAKLLKGEDRVVLGGFSQGGAITLSAALSKSLPNVIAFVSLSAYIPDPDQYSQGGNKVPFLLCHGDSDPVIHPSAGQEAHAKLQTLGLSSTFHMFPGMAHSARPDEFQTITTFLNDVLNDTKEDLL